METLSFLKRSTTDKDGNALIRKDGKSYTRLSIKVLSKGDRFISGFGNAENANWAVGDEVDITITEAEAKDKNGNPYLNFSMPKAQDKSLAELDGKIEDILNKITGIGLRIGVLADYIMENNPKKKTYPVNNDPVPFPEEEVNPNDVPF